MTAPPAPLGEEITAEISSNRHHLKGVRDVDAHARQEHDQALERYLAMARYRGDQTGIARAAGVLYTEIGQADRAAGHTAESLAHHAAMDEEVTTDLYWLRRQRRVLGEIRFQECLLERSIRRRLKKLLDYLDELEPGIGIQAG